jgi:ketosteroid isomerase-like protein
MKKFIYFFVLLLAIRFARAQEKTQMEISAIKAARTASNAAIARHDVEGIAKYWLPDFVQVSGNTRSMKGKDSLMRAWSQLFNSNPDVSYLRSPTDIIISFNDTLAWETGNWTAIKSYSRGGNYSAMWRKVDGSWKLQAELFVSLH